MAAGPPRSARTWPDALCTRVRSCRQALGVNDDSLFFVLFGVVGAVGFAFSQWQDYQDDDEDYFDTYDSRRTDREVTNRNRV